MSASFRLISPRRQPLTLVTSERVIRLHAADVFDVDAARHACCRAAAIRDIRAILATPKMAIQAPRDALCAQR